MMNLEWGIRILYQEFFEFDSVFLRGYYILMNKTAAIWMSMMMPKRKGCLKAV